MKKIPVPLKRIATWMDHSEARLFQIGPAVEMTQTIYSPFSGQDREAGEGDNKTKVGKVRSSNNEDSKHDKEIRMRKIYYKKIAETLEPYNEILVFGPTTAGEELYNYLRRTKKFAGKIIHVKNTDYQTKRQMLAYVKKHFK